MMDSDEIYIESVTPSRKKPLESTVEEYFVKQVESNLGWQCRKWKTRRADPDRICLTGNGRVVFVELKRPKESARTEQEREHRRLRKDGYQVFIVTSKPEVDDFIRQQQWEDR